MRCRLIGSEITPGSRVEARRRTPTTSACCSSVIPAHSGRHRFARAASRSPGSPRPSSRGSGARAAVERRLVARRRNRSPPRRAPPGGGPARWRCGRSTCGRRGQARQPVAPRRRPGRARRTVRRLRGGRRSTGEVRQGDTEHRSLEGVEAGVVADVLELLLRPRAVEAEHPDPVGQSSASLTATSPPSPRPNRFFVGKKLNVEAMLVAMPREPNACAASSTIGRPNRRSSPSGRAGRRGARA